jgi:hypothetical protein
MHSYGGSTIAREAVVAIFPVPDWVLRETFGLLRVVRSSLHAASLTYVYGKPHRNLLGQTVCLGYRITDHPLPPPPQRSDPTRPFAFTNQPPPPTPSAETVEVPCEEGRLERVPPGSLTTPVPLHP